MLLKFSYRALGKDGKEISGVLHADSRREAISRIREDYPVLLSIRQQKEKQDLSALLKLELGNRRMKAKTLSVLCSQLSIMLRSGISVARAFQILAGQNADKQLRKMMEQTARDVEAGNSVASALEQYRECFPPTFIETVRAGEESGTLANSFARLRSFYEKSYKTTEKIKSALTYPLFVIVVAVVVLIVVMAKVIPSLTVVFTNLGGELPQMTKLLIAVSDFFAQWWLVLFFIFFIVLVCIKLYTKTPQGRLLRAKCSLLFPLVGKVNRINAAAQFANTMSVLLEAGIVLDQAIDTTARVMENALFQKETYGMKHDLEQGHSLSDCLRNRECFPSAMADMCAIGEETGALEETLNNIADYYTNEADYLVQRLLVLLEPMLLLFLSVFAGIIVVSIYLPVFTMYDLI